MNEPEWIERDVVLAIHDAQLAEHGGPGGIRDQGLLESALARLVRHLYSYTPEIAFHDLAASYAAGLTKNHAFVDGNKRSAWVVCAVFLEINGIEVTADQGEVVEKMLALAAGDIDEQQFAAWLRMSGVTGASSGA